MYETLAYIIFVFLLPLSVLIVFNTHLCIELRRASRNRRATLASRRSRDENNITLVMIVIILIFIACQTPACVNQILYHTIGKRPTSGCSSYERFYHISNLLITCNSATNFFVYFLFRRKFQTELWTLLSCKKVKPASVRGRTVTAANAHLLRRGTVTGSVTRSTHTPETARITAKKVTPRRERCNGVCKRQWSLKCESIHDRRAQTCKCKQQQQKQLVRAHSWSHVPDTRHVTRSNGHITAT